MEKISVANSRYSYINEGDWPNGSVDIHRVAVRKSFLKAFFVAIILLPIACCYFFVYSFKLEISEWDFLFLFVELSAEFNPAHVIDLEACRQRGKIIRRFIPAGEILKPVLLECVTPVTCYWTLSLLVRGKEDLMLVFKELRPPMKMLLPVWKALCASIDQKENPVTYREDG
ncbi:hypothetical protein COLO4_22553 [Corchorus olitorius]|uniref:Phosphatidylinositol N-acetylglucosaminyltransferase subunit H conserved domain-containing protein n=1 Tax=Corchorus olitorius TaxID=93759 RepID=A0A1R3ILE3_9ROSI|nr:hypothetical protein COLO4_22553 [Corchorus olitorius]